MKKISLNPYFSGRYVQSCSRYLTLQTCGFVLILISVEDTFRGTMTFIIHKRLQVLILISVEDTFRAFTFMSLGKHLYMS